MKTKPRLAVLATAILLPPTLESPHVSFLWFARGREAGGSEVWIKDDFPSLHEKLLKDVESLNADKIPAKREDVSTQIAAKCATRFFVFLRRMTARFRALQTF